jgi:hypothetical protein
MDSVVTERRETVPFTSRVALYARTSHPESQRLIPTSHRRIDLLLQEGITARTVIDT